MAGLAGLSGAGPFPGLLTQAPPARAATSATSPVTASETASGAKQARGGSSEAEAAVGAKRLRVEEAASPSADALMMLSAASPSPSKATARVHEPEVPFSLGHYFTSLSCWMTSRHLHRAPLCFFHPCARVLTGDVCRGGVSDVLPSCGAATGGGGRCRRLGGGYCGPGVAGGAPWRRAVVRGAAGQAAEAYGAGAGRRGGADAVPPAGTGRHRRTAFSESSHGPRHKGATPAHTFGAHQEHAMPLVRGVRPWWLTLRAFLFSPSRPCSSSSTSNFFSRWGPSSRLSSSKPCCSSNSVSSSSSSRVRVRERGLRSSSSSRSSRSSKRKRNNLNRNRCPHRRPPSRPGSRSRVNTAAALSFPLAGGLHRSAPLAGVLLWLEFCSRGTRPRGTQKKP